MTIHVQIATTILTTLLFSCITKSNNKKNDTTNNIYKSITPIDTPRSFVKNYGVLDNFLFVFVGEKIEVTPIHLREGAFDNGYKAKYIVLKKVYGEFPEDTIEFVVYDHYGTPSFSKYKNVLLFVSADSGTYYHQKYMYNDVYETKDGRWAGSYSEDDYDHNYNKHTKIKPIKIDFLNEVSYPTKVITEDGNGFALTYPKPYFKIVGEKAVAVYGNYIEDLFKLKRDGYLTARGLFGNKK